jgi:hypothetical protein
MSMCLLMLLITNTAIAQTPVHTAASSPAAASAITPFFLYDSAATNVIPWRQTHTIVDASGGMHTAFNTYQSIFYAHCAKNCGSLANWTETVISANGPYDSLEYPTLAIDPQGRPRMMYFWGQNDDVVYAECNKSPCSTAGNWSFVHVPISQSWANYAHDNQYFALDTKGRPRFMLSRSGGFQYVVCDSACTTAANWHNYSIGVSVANTWIDADKLVFNASDNPRAVGFDTNTEKIYYLQCDSNCSLSANWSAVALGTVGYYYDDYGYSLRLDAQGHPRIVYFKAATDNKLYYTWSNTNSNQASGWHSDSLDLPPYDYSRSVDLAIDSQGLPRVAVATKDGDLAYVVCTGLCETTSSTWQLYTIETGSALDAAYPSALPANCISQAWEVEGYTSLALDSADNSSLSYYVNHAMFCYDSYGNLKTLFDRKGLRFASLGSEGGPVYQAYLPTIKNK